MGASGGRRRAEPATKPPSPLLVLGGLFGGAAISAVAWFFLVNAAIDFGGEAKNGRGMAWVFMLLATLGAIACLVFVLVLGARGLGLLGITGGAKTSEGSSGQRSSHKH